MRHGSDHIYLILQFCNSCIDSEPLDDDVSKSEANLKMFLGNFLSNFTKSQFLEILISSSRHHDDVIILGVNCIEFHSVNFSQWDNFAD